MSLLEAVRKKVSIPKYFTEQINGSVDLIETPSICCPFHDDHSPSFTYSLEKNMWRCWSNCGGGDVVEMHRINKKLHSREEALESLAQLYHVVPEFKVEPRKDVVRDVVKDKYKLLLTEAAMRVSTPEEYIALDRIMGYHLRIDEMIPLLENMVREL